LGVDRIPQSVEGQSKAVERTNRARLAHGVPRAEGEGTAVVAEATGSCKDARRRCQAVKVRGYAVQSSLYRARMQFAAAECFKQTTVSGREEPHHVQASRNRGMAGWYAGAADAKMLLS
jgi:hypothetical protein